MEQHEQAFPGARRHTIVYDNQILGGPVVRKGGYLIKQGYERKSWKRRFFTLAGHNLHYFRDDNMTEKLGMIPLAGCRIVLQAALKSNCFSISHPHRRTYFLSADSDHQMEEWIRDILEVIGEIGDEDTLKSLQTYDLPGFDDLLLSKAEDFPEIKDLVYQNKGPKKCIRMQIARAEDLCLAKELLEKHLYCKVEVTLKSSSPNPGILEMVSPSFQAQNCPQLKLDYFFSLQQLKEEVSKVRISLHLTTKPRTKRFLEFHPTNSGAAVPPHPGSETDDFLGEVWLDPSKIIKSEKKSANSRWILKIPSSYRGDQDRHSHGVIYTAFSYMFLTPSEMDRLGKEKVSQAHFATAKQLFQLAADAKYAAAVCALGWWYCHGYGLPSEEYLGFELYQKAAAQGDKTAQNNVGYCYQYGIGVAQDDQLARHWYTRAIEQSDFLPSFVNLGLMLLDSDADGHPNPQKARGLFLKAAARGSPEGQNNLGYCFQTGTGGNSNSKEAYDLFCKAAKSGYPPAYHNLGQCYEFGLGIEESKEEAFKWYEKGAKAGHNESLLAVGLCYEKGIGTAKDEMKARKAFGEALGVAEKGPEVNMPL
uniref:PH domain-containing protein n=1 Tax=Paramoeba aestuarina TaxID=180227 RepID=A0A7S4KHL1_9EUKA